MPRNISFFMTTAQVQDRTKDVTRRLAWWNLKPGTRLTGVRKAQGLKRGEKIERLCEIEVVSVRQEPLNAITQDDVIREVFPDWTPEQYVDLMVNAHKCARDETINRIEFKYIQ